MLKRTRVLVWRLLEVDRPHGIYESLLHHVREAGG